MSPSRRAFLGQVIVAGLAPTGPALAQSAPDPSAPTPGGPATAALAIRAEELKQRSEGLRAELDQWLGRAATELDAQTHFSQLKAIKHVLDTFFKRQGELLGTFPGAEPSSFLVKSDELLVSLFHSQFFWDFFREKLQLRFIPALKDNLWLADTVAFDCYRPVLAEAETLEIVDPDELREPPLCYYSVEFTAGTVPRNSTPEGLDRGGSLSFPTPIPVIDIPWAQAANSWDFTILAHEVGHNLESDLLLIDPLRDRLESALQDAGVDQDRRDVWGRWRREVLADFVALQLVGPAFLDAIMQVLLRPAATATRLTPNSVHPTAHVRMLMIVDYARTLLRDDQHPAAAAARAAVETHAARVEGIWRGLYGNPEPLRPYLDDAPKVAAALMDSPLPALKGSTVRQLMPFTAADDARSRAAADFLRTGVNPPGPLRPRLVAAAARIAVDHTARDAAALPAALVAIRQRTAELIRKNSPPGVRSVNNSARHRRFLERYAAPPQGGGNE